MGCIYCIQNLITNKRYIGQTKQRLSKRIYQHWMQARKGVDTPLYHAIRKYSKQDFKIFTLEECNICLLDEKEQYWIEHFNTLKEGYNCNKGGQGTLGFRHSEETKIKMSLSKKGKVSSQKGKKMSEEQKKKISLSLQKAYSEGRRTDRTYDEVRGENNANYKNGKYSGWYSRYKKKRIT